VILRAVVLIAALMVIGLIVALSISYTLARTNLLGTSEIAETERGVVECYREGIGSAVVIVHGTPGGYDQFLTLGRLISSRGYSVVCFSRPGYLRSPLRSNKSPADQAAIIAALMSSLSIQKASVIGISGGGPSAIKFAIDFPECTKSVVLIAALSGEPHRNLSEDDPRGRKRDRRHQVSTRLYVPRHLYLGARKNREAWIRQHG